MLFTNYEMAFTPPATLGQHVGEPYHPQTEPGVDGFLLAGGCRVAKA